MVVSLLVSGCGVALRDNLLGEAVTWIQQAGGHGHYAAAPPPPYLVKDAPQAPLIIIGKLIKRTSWPWVA